MKSSEQIVVRRRWKRDGTCNFMGVPAAVENLLVNQLVPKGGRKLTRQQLEGQLLRGDIIPTPLAEFQIYTGTKVEEAPSDWKDLIRI